MLNFSKRSINIDLLAPLTGNMIRLIEVPDEVFSDKTVGAGIAIKPEIGKVFAPAAGIVKRTFPTKHAIGIEVLNRIEILIHVGIDTVELEGKGFNYLVQQGKEVKAGDLLMEFDLEYVKKNALSALTPVVIPNKKAIKEIKFDKFKKVKGGKDKIFTATLF